MIAATTQQQPTTRLKTETKANKAFGRLLQYTGTVDYHQKLLIAREQSDKSYRRPQQMVTLANQQNEKRSQE